jgi:predicted nucleotidyltransferase
MGKEIQTRLMEIEEEYGVNIIFACEAGSRIWGTDYEESDYDVRFLYIYPLKKYIELDAPKDSIEGKKQLKIECSGWELGKALRLLRKQNPSIIEWMHSPLNYVNKFQIKEQLISLQRSYYNKKPLLHHYINMAVRNQSLLMKNNSSIKLQLHIIRSLLVCQWIIHSDCFPPLSVENLLEDHIEEDVRMRIAHLISIKKSAIQKAEVDPVLSDWSQNQLEELTDTITSIKKLPTFSNRNFTTELNTLYRSIILFK